MDGHCSVSGRLPITANKYVFGTEFVSLITKRPMYYRYTRSRSSVNVKGQTDSVKRCLSSNCTLLFVMKSESLESHHGNDRILIRSCEIAVCAHAQYKIGQKAVQNDWRTCTLPRPNNKIRKYLTSCSTGVGMQTSVYSRHVWGESFPSKISKSPPQKKITMCQIHVWKDHSLQ